MVEKTQVPVDNKGRVLATEMSDRELMIETLIHLRTMMDIFEGLGKHPMAASLGMAFPSNTPRAR